MSDYEAIRQYRIHGPRLRLLFAQRRNVGHWTFEDLQAPYWRLYHMKSEGARLRTDDQVHALDPRHLYILPAHLHFGTGADREVSQLFVHFTLDPAPPPESPSLTSVPVTPGLQELLNSLDASESEDQPFLLTALVQAALVAAGLPLRDRSLTTRMEKSQQLIRRHLKSGISNPELAAAVNLSENGFIRWFTAEAGISPQAWLNRERVHEASFWLHHTDAPLEQIAELHGFCDRYHFSRVFKRIQGQSPAAFRRNREPASPPLTVKA